MLSVTQAASLRLIELDVEERRSFAVQHRLRLELRDLEDHLEEVNRAAIDDAVRRRASGGGDRILTFAELRHRRELDALALVRRGGRAVCVWLTCPKCHRPFAAVAIPAGAKFCRRCAAPKQVKKVRSR